MKRFRLVLIILFAVAMVGLIIFAILSERQRIESMDAIETPPEIAFHEELAIALQQDDDMQEPPSPELKAALDTITSWAALFERKKNEVDGDEWDTVLDLWQAADGWKSLSAEETDQILRFLDAHQEFIAALRNQAALGGPVHVTSLSDTHGAKVEHLPVIRDCARLLGLDAVARAHTGAMKQAVSDSIAGLHLADALAPDPMLIAQLCRIAMTSIAYSRLQEAFPPGTLSNADTARLLYQAQESPGRESMVAALEYTRMEYNQRFDTLLNQDWYGRYKKMEPAFLVFDKSLANRAATIAYASPLARPWLNRDITRNAEFMGHVIGVAHLPYYEAMKQHDDSVNGFYPYAKLRDPQAFRDLASEARREALLQLLQLGLTLEQHHVIHGSFPPTLDALSGSFPENTLVDPYSGAQFIYKAENNEFLLYSVGQNLQDDGGNHDLTQGDIVWRGD